MTVEASGAHQGLVTPVEPIFAKRQRTDRCCLVLSGQLRITCSEDNLESEAGPWSILALQALIDPDYTPDYAAEVITTARLLFISKQQYDEMLRNAPDGDGRPADAKWLGRVREQSGPVNGIPGGRHPTGIERALSPATPRGCTFDWDASTQRNSGASRVVESASAMLSRPPRPKVRSHDDSDAPREPVAAGAPGNPFGFPVLMRSHSHPEVSVDGEVDEDQRPLCDLLADFVEPNSSGSLARAQFEVTPATSRVASGGALASTAVAGDARPANASGAGPQQGQGRGASIPRSRSLLE